MRRKHGRHTHKGTGDEDGISHENCERAGKRRAASFGDGSFKDKERIGAGRDDDGKCAQHINPKVNDSELEHG